MKEEFKNSEDEVQKHIHFITVEVKECVKKSVYELIKTYVNNKTSHGKNRASVKLIKSFTSSANGKTRNK